MPQVFVTHKRKEPWRWHGQGSFSIFLPENQLHAASVPAQSSRYPTSWIKFRLSRQFAPRNVPFRGDPEFHFPSSGQVNCPCGKVRAMRPGRLDAPDGAARSRAQENWPCRCMCLLSPHDCDCNTENRHAVSHILAGIMQHAPGSRSNILPGSAPALHSVILYPFFPLPLPLAHPITLTPYPGAEPAPCPGNVPGCVNICFIFRREHRRFPHILRQNG